VKDGSPVTAQAKDPAGNESAVVSQPAGNNKVVKLELSLAQDTGASNNDNYTRNGQVNVSGIPSGSEWEYSTDGGQTWNSGSGNSFTLPNNTKVGGIAYSLQARVKGNAASASDTLNMTLDQKAGEFHAIIDGSMNLIGTAEKNSTISINNRSGKANANGEFEFATGIASGATAKKVHYSVVETDLAGNSVSKDVAYTYYRRFAGNTNETYGNENDVILIGTKGGTGDLGALIRSSLTTGSGDDSVYATGVQYRSNTLDMGNGNDFASFKNIAGTINMGAGNDILEARETGNGFFYLAGGNPTINMGAGDDIVRTSSTINTRASIDGGSDFDTLQFVNRDGKAITTTISMISNFEKIDITGTSNNSVTISASDVDRNHSAKATVDASGKSHNNVLIVDGDAGDKVTLSGISKAASSQVTHEGNTYNVYNTGSNELWVDSDITIA
jgi:hemagglutinin/hemolysin-like protein